MTYEGTIYRPPPEADSLIVQVTIGCAWNKCTFCNMYADKQFRIRPLEDIKKDLREGSRYAFGIRRIFLCDGDALVLPFDFLMELLGEIRTLFPKLEGVRLYSSAKDILGKTPEQLKALAEAGLDMVYMGLETGSDQILKEVNKGISKQEMIDAAHRLKQAGIQLYVSIIAGLGGPELSEEHMTETADSLNQMQPGHVGMLVLQISEHSKLYQKVQQGAFQPPKAKQVLWEMKILLENLKLSNCYFSSAHISNYVNMSGHLPQDQQAMLAAISRLWQQI